LILIDLDDVVHVVWSRKIMLSSIQH